GFAWCDCHDLLPDLLTPDISEDVWFDALCEKLARQQSRFLFVGADFELLPLARRATELQDRTGCIVVVSSAELVRACKDKLETPQLLRRCGFPAPDTLTGVAGVDVIEQRLGYPLVVKPRYGARSRG